MFVFPEFHAGIGTAPQNLVCQTGNMPMIDFRRKHSLVLDDARAKAEEFARSIENRLGVRWQWEDALCMKLDAPAGPAKGTTGVVTLGPEDLHIAIQLPRLLGAMKGLVERKLQRKLELMLGPV
jgi:putative polyhydroxyalkanoate system protein